ncbi:MAG: hypothetical protein HF973_03505 [Chloroflexi bacterium]|nr:hypothetical protein [Chloroflexota bacterium]
MAVKLKTVINDARTLSPQEQLQLISALTQSLQLAYLEYATKTGFWQPEPIDQLVEKQQPVTINDLNDLAGNVWPEGDSIDDFLAFLEQERKEDKMSVQEL